MPFTWEAQGFDPGAPCAELQARRAHRIRGQAIAIASEVHLKGTGSGEVSSAAPALEAAAGALHAATERCVT
jgi:hypothetical protein